MFCFFCWTSTDRPDCVQNEMALRINLQKQVVVLEREVEAAAECGARGTIHPGIYKVNDPDASVKCSPPLQADISDRQEDIKSNDPNASMLYQPGAKSSIFRSTTSRRRSTSSSHDAVARVHSLGHDLAVHLAACESSLQSIQSSLTDSTPALNPIQVRSPSYVQKHQRNANDDALCIQLVVQTLFESAQLCTIPH